MVTKSDKEFLIRQWARRSLPSPRPTVDKPRYSLIFWPFVRGLARVLGHGAKKYGDYAWQSSQDAESKYRDKAIRHLMDGGDFDGETGEDPLLHVAANLMFLYWHRAKKSEGKSNA